MSNDARSLGMGHDDAPQGWRGAADGGHQGEKLGVPEGGGAGRGKRGLAKLRHGRSTR